MSSRSCRVPSFYAQPTLVTNLPFLDSATLCAGVKFAAPKICSKKIEDAMNDQGGLGEKEVARERMSRRNDWLPMLVESRDQRHQRQELFWVYVGPMLAVLGLFALLSAIG